VGQTGVDVRLLLIVNGTRFDQVLMDEMRSRSKLEVHYLKEASLPAALRYGRSVVATPFFAFLDDDDEYLPGALHLRVSCLLQDDRLAVVATNGYKRVEDADVLLYDRSRVPQGNYLDAILSRGNWLASGGAAYRSSQVGLEYFDGSTKYYEWTFLGFRLALDNLHILFINVPTFRLYDTPSSLQKTEAYKTASVHLTDAMLRLAMPKKILKRVQKLRLRAFHELCKYHRVKGDFAQAWGFHLRSLRMPSGFKYLPYTILLLLRVSYSRMGGPLTRAFLVGNKHFGERLKHQLEPLGCHLTVPAVIGRGTPLELLGSGADILYQVGGPRVAKGLRLICSLARIRIVMHWIGSDVTEALRSGSRQSKRDAKGIVHWADAPWLVEELRTIGVEAKLMPLFVSSRAAALPFPRGPFTVLIYLPDSRFDFYNGRMLMEVATSLPTVRFLVVGGKGVAVQRPDNVRFVGWVENMTPIYEQIHVLVRMPQHDGFSFMVAEALRHERYVIWNHKYPHVIKASTHAEVQNHLSHLKAVNDSGGLRPNQRGREYVLEQYSEAVSVRRISDGFKSIAATRRKIAGLREASRNAPYEASCAS
jgi:hypothetical protein